MRLLACTQRVLSTIYASTPAVISRMCADMVRDVFGKRVGSVLVWGLALTHMMVLLLVVN